MEEKNIVKSIRKLDDAMKKLVYTNKELFKSFSLTQYRVLIYLARHADEETCQKDLEVETGLKKASITAVIDGLEEKGYIRRTTAKDDRRRNIIVLSEKSDEIIKSVRERYRRLEEEVANNISEEELNTFIRVAEKMASCMEKEKLK